MRRLERVFPQGRLLPAQELDTYTNQGMDESSNHSREELEESSPEKSDVEKLQESIQEIEKNETDLKRNLERAGGEIQKYKEELETVKSELHGLKVMVEEKSKALRNLKATVDQHKSELDKTPMLINQASQDLKLKFQEEKSNRSQLQVNTSKRFAQVQSSIQSVKSEVDSELPPKLETQIQAKIPELQLYMKEELEKNMQQLPSDSV